MIPNLNIFDPDRKIIFQQLADFKKIGYLAGGTALALQFGHRISYDFDIFCAKPISKELIKKIRQTFPIQEIVINNVDEFTFFTKQQIKVSFF
jgi:hypothetical protein